MLEYPYRKIAYCAQNIERLIIMEILESILLIVLLVSALLIIAAVLLQKSSDEGLSGTIAGTSDTFYGKDKSSHSDRTLFICTVIAAIVFVAAVFLVYVIQPDFSLTFSLDSWKEQPAAFQGYSHINKYISYFN